MIEPACCALNAKFSISQVCGLTRCSNDIKSPGPSSNDASGSRPPKASRGHRNKHEHNPNKVISAVPATSADKMADPRQMWEKLQKGLRTAQQQGQTVAARLTTASAARHSRCHTTNKSVLAIKLKRAPVEPVGGQPICKPHFRQAGPGL